MAADVLRQKRDTSRLWHVTAFSTDRALCGQQLHGHVLRLRDAGATVPTCNLCERKVRAAA